LTPSKRRPSSLGKTKGALLKGAKRTKWEIQTHGGDLQGKVITPWSSWQETSTVGYISEASRLLAYWHGAATQRASPGAQNHCEQSHEFLA